MCSSRPATHCLTFLGRYGTEAQCERALEQIRWPDGFFCPQCRHGASRVPAQQRCDVPAMLGLPTPDQLADVVMDNTMNC